MDKEKLEFDFGCRWEECAELAVEKLGGGVKFLRSAYENGYQGYLDVDVLLRDGRVFSYKYFYGSCSVCDPWEDSFSGNDGADMFARYILDEATIFDNIDEYNKWREMVKNGQRSHD